MTTSDLVAYLLDNRHRLPDRAILNCLALARMKPPPGRRILAEELMGVLGHSQRNGISGLLLELKRCGLVEFEPGWKGTPGYLIQRVGPVVPRPAVPPTCWLRK